jgi:hypothetical protein
MGHSASPCSNLVAIEMEFPVRPLDRTSEFQLSPKPHKSAPNCDMFYADILGKHSRLILLIDRQDEGSAREP